MQLLVAGMKLIHFQSFILDATWRLHLSNPRGVGGSTMNSAIKAKHLPVILDSSLHPFMT